MGNAGLPNAAGKRTAEWRDVDAATFREKIIPADRPAVLKGLVRDWACVREARRSPQALCDYLKTFDNGHAVQTAIGPPAIKGRLFYRDDMTGFNFERVNETFQAALERILAHQDDPAPLAVALPPECLGERIRPPARAKIPDGVYLTKVTLDQFRAAGMLNKKYFTPLTTYTTRIRNGRWTQTQTPMQTQMRSS